MGPHHLEGAHSSCPSVDNKKIVASTAQEIEDVEVDQQE